MQYEGDFFPHEQFQFVQFHGCWKLILDDLIFHQYIYFFKKCNIIVGVATGGGKQWHYIYFLKLSTYWLP